MLDELRKKPSSLFGKTIIEKPEETEKAKKEKLEVRKKHVIEKPKPMRHKPKRMTKTDRINMFSVIAIILSIIAIIFASAALTGPGIDKNELRGIASDLRALNNKQITVNVPINTQLYFSNAIPANQLFSGAQEIPVAFQIPIKHTFKGKDVRTGIPVDVYVEETIEAEAVITIDLTTSSISLELVSPAQASGTAASTITVKDVYGDEISSIADRLDRMAEG